MDNEKNLIRDALSGFGPTNEQKESMWNRIESAADRAESAMGAAERIEVRAREDVNGRAAEEAAFRPVAARAAAANAGNKAGANAGTRRGGKAKSALFIRRLVAAAAALVLVLGGIGYFTGGSDSDLPIFTGRVYAAEVRDTGLTPEDVLVSTGDPVENATLYVYAPKVYFADDSRLIFGNSTGLIIYDRMADKVSGLVDMQAICSSYYNTDSVVTHVFVRGDELVVYNTKDGKAWGFYHIFDLSALPGSASLIKYTKSDDDQATLDSLAEEGSAYEAEHYIDAWDNIEFLHSDEMDDAIGYGYGTYSEQVFKYADSDGTEVSALLIDRVENGGYEILTQANGSDPDFSDLELGITGEMVRGVLEKNIMPKYKYTGDDEMLRAICEKQSEEIAEEMVDMYQVCIPGPVVYGVYEKDGETLVFGDFWEESYVRNGNTLVSTSGGSWPGCYHLRKNGDAYEVVSFEHADEGELYAESIAKMTDGFPGLSDKFLSGNSSEESDKARLEAVKAYVKSTGMDVKYCKDFGWDPIELD